MAYLISRKSLKRTPARGHELGSNANASRKQARTLFKIEKKRKKAHSKSAVDKGKSERDADKSRCLLLPASRNQRAAKGGAAYRVFSQDGPGIRIYVMD